MCFFYLRSHGYVIIHRLFRHVQDVSVLDGISDAESSRKNKEFDYKTHINMIKANLFTKHLF